MSNLVDTERGFSTPEDPYHPWTQGLVSALLAHSIPHLAGIIRADRSIRSRPRRRKSVAADEVCTLRIEVKKGMNLLQDTAVDTLAAEAPVRLASAAPSPSRLPAAAVTSTAMAAKKAESSEPKATPIAGKQCKLCIYRLQNELACVAFPWGIPADIQEDRFDHRQAYPGDGGFRFAPRR